MESINPVKFSWNTFQNSSKRSQFSSFTDEILEFVFWICWRVTEGSSSIHEELKKHISSTYHGFGLPKQDSSRQTMNNDKHDILKL